MKKRRAPNSGRFARLGGSAAPEAELRKSRDYLIQQERLRMLGEAAAAVAHDLGSTLRALAFGVAALRSDAALERKHRRSLEALDEGVESAASVVRRLHEFARAGSLRRELVQPGVIVRQAVAVFELENTAHPDIRLEVDVDELPFVRGSAAELSHLFLNLLRNAREAMGGDGGAIRIRGRARRREVQIDVADQGPGVAPGDMKRLFQPFFTTKQGGTGLGLWLASGSVRRMGGSISARRGRKGMVFTVMLPRAPRTRRPARRR